MKSDLERQLIQEIEVLKQKVALLEGQKEPPIPTYQYSQIRDRDLSRLFEIERQLDPHRFDPWFQTAIDIEPPVMDFLSALLDEHALLIDSYGEEDLKINVIAPLLKQVRFTSYEKRLREFYEVPMTYATPRFILSGTVDFMVAEGLIEHKRPYFFIQEFKRSEDYGNPRPQLLAELISALELNEWTEIKGAYIIGGSWHFVILDKVCDDTYQYVVSQSFDSTKLDDITLIYKHLVSVRQDILRQLDQERQKRPSETS